MNSNLFLSYLIEIFDGFTRFDLDGQTLFFRHFSLRNQNLIFTNYEKFKSKAVKRGIETQEQIYERLKEDGTWTSDDDLKIEELELYLKNLKNTKSKLFLPSQKEAHQKLIDEEEQKLINLKSKKVELVSISAEDYANKMSNEEFLRHLIYEDETLTKLKFSQEEFGELVSSQLTIISDAYFDMSNKFNDDNLQKIVLEDFFNIYLSLCEDPYKFYGKFINQLSAYQLKILLYGRVFNNIFQYNEDIPENIKKDPKAIFSYVDSKKTREKFQEENKDVDGTILFGATSQDVQMLDPSAKKISLQDEIEKNGGSLNMEQMMKLMGN